MFVVRVMMLLPACIVVGMAWYGDWEGMVWGAVLCYGEVWYGLVWYGRVGCLLLFVLMALICI